MQVAKIQIRNILGIKTLEYKPGKITTISGKNKAGKTSFLEAIKGILGGGHDGTLLRNGADEGEIVLVFDNGETLTKKMTQDKSHVTFEDAEGKKMKLGASYLKEIIDPVGLNPIQILTADPKARIKMLLNSVPMTMPSDEIKFIAGLDRSEKDGHPLQVIEEIRKSIFEERAYVNKEAVTMETMVSEMRKTIPFQEDKKDWTIEVEVVRTELEKLNEIRDKGLKEADELRHKLINDAKETTQEKIDTLNKQLADYTQECQNAHEQSAKNVLDEFCKMADPGKEKLTEADQNSKNQHKISGAIDFVEKKGAEIKLLEKEAKDQTGQIDDLDKLKGELMENLPVKDLKVFDGDIYINDIPFDTLNEAARIRFCLMIAGLRKTKLPLVCVDGLEALDEKNRAIFIEEAEKTDMQYFVTQVSDEEGLTLN